MKTLRLRFLWGALVWAAVAGGAPAGADDRPRELARLEHTAAFDSAEAASAWRFEALPHDTWLHDIAPRGAEMLHSEEAPTHSAAIYRYRGHLVVWLTHRTQPFGRQENLSVRAADPDLGDPTTPGTPSRWIAVEHRLTFPHGGFTHNATGPAWAIRDDFRGDLLVVVTRQDRAGERREVLRATVPWAP